ncbi:hypothetical protein V6N12_026901 [Hibiscus sabdariffa]|uniref:Uncharacterized protein n=1 Tax=Hibiscus sabdariffa TaxID=183260 RepID=A0ABR2DT54_9ROSI
MVSPNSLVVARFLKLNFGGFVLVFLWLGIEVFRCIMVESDCLEAVHMLHPSFSNGFPIFHFGPESKDVGWLLDPVLGLPQVDSAGLSNLVADVVETRREGGWFSLALGFFSTNASSPCLGECATLWATSFDQMVSLKEWAYKSLGL